LSSENLCVAASIVAKSNFKDSMVVIVLAAMHRNGINVRSTPQEQFAGMRKLKHYCKNPKLSSLCTFLSNSPKKTSKLSSHILFMN
jgi:hypothetical protein